MTIVSSIQTTDVAVLKCIYFQLVKSLIEIGWYGIDCNKDKYVSDIQTSFMYLQVLDSNCPIDRQFQCEIKNFITTKSSFCIFSNSKNCTKYSTIELLDFLTDENLVNITTDTNQNIQI